MDAIIRFINILGENAISYIPAVAIFAVASIFLSKRFKTAYMFKAGKAATLLSIFGWISSALLVLLIIVAIINAYSTKSYKDFISHHDIKSDSVISVIYVRNGSDGNDIIFYDESGKVQKFSVKSNKAGVIFVYDSNIDENHEVKIKNSSSIFLFIKNEKSNNKINEERCTENKNILSGALSYYSDPDKFVFISPDNGIFVGNAEVITDRNVKGQYLLNCEGLSGKTQYVILSGETLPNSTYDNQIEPYLTNKKNNENKKYSVKIGDFITSDLTFFISEDGDCTETNSSLNKIYYTGLNKDYLLYDKKTDSYFAFIKKDKKEVLSSFLETQKAELRNIAILYQKDSKFIYQNKDGYILKGSADAIVHTSEVDHDILMSVKTHNGEKCNNFWLLIESDKRNPDIYHKFVSYSKYMSNHKSATNQKFGFKKTDNPIIAGFDGFACEYSFRAQGDDNTYDIEIDGYGFDDTLTEPKLIKNNGKIYAFLVPALQ